MNIHLYPSVNLIDVEYSIAGEKDIYPQIYPYKRPRGSRGKAPGGLGKAQPKAKFSPAFFKRRWGPGAKPRVGVQGARPPGQTQNLPNLPIKLSGY